MTVRPPIVGAALWTAVMRNAGHRCECRGACGSKHDPNRRGAQHRCPLENGKHVSKRGEIVLIAMPRDPVNESSFVTAAQLPARRLAAMCPPCYDAVRRKIKAAEKKLAPQGDGLFDAAEFYVAPASTKQADVGAA
ncbi:hypothetical protein SMD44_00993 [Streptomyces alboflavus]|uniref:Uncharacterized protein n=1 Tax=Streptomyces alboflavus TaxID=67267 RepID=A0A1Z1W590_9ACTN|nr:hypothetical protein [Streptomyces alboflavus]ARX81595.1 hypothetical protein SMD44_00993 [Streptomyces alboflavus]